MAEGGDQRSEKPTQHRLQKAREEGTIPYSKEVVSVATFAAGVTALYMSRQLWVERWAHLWERTCLNLPQSTTESSGLWERAVEGSLLFSVSLVPFLGALVAAALVAGLAQSRFLFAIKVLTPKWDRLDPLAGIQRLWSVKSLVETLWLVAKVVGLLVIGWTGMRVFWDGAPQLMDASPAGLFGLTAQASYHTAMRCVLVLGLLAGADYFYRRRHTQNQLMMTKREIKEEMKELDGNPQIKSRIKQLMRKMATRRMMSRVPKADVVITNPTHLAIALQYTKRMRAPEVVAKGADLIAERIKDIARQNHVPLVENRPLARLLYAKSEVGQPVPVSLYQAVAEVLAYVYRLRPRSAS